MLKDLYTGTLSTNLDYSKSTSGHNWDCLMSLWNQTSHSSLIKFYVDEVPSEGSCWFIEESNQVMPDFHFKMKRSRLNHYRTTLEDSTGLLGLSLINLNDKRVILTEGVSDFITAKLLCPNNNVLGLTTLSGSASSKRILLSLFDTFIYCADNDSTGLSTGSKMKSFLESFGKSCQLFTAPSPHKDLSDAFLFNVKLNSNV